MKNALMAVLLVTALFAAGCSGGGTDQGETSGETAGKSAPAVVNYENLADSMEDIKGYSEWTLVDENVQSPSHNGAIKDIYANDIAAAAIESGTLPMPAGSIIVKENYKNNDGQKGDLAALTTMVKMPEGYDPEHGNWGYFKTAPDFTVNAEGKVSSCIECHLDAKDTDYLFIVAE